MIELIEHMGSYFAAADHDVTAPEFAASVLAHQQAVVNRALASGAVVPAAMVNAVRRTTLGDPAGAVGDPLPAYVNAGRWLVHCPDCAGCEFVDFTNPVFMCCSCWNAKVGGAWRPVALPAEPETPADEFATGGPIRPGGAIVDLAADGPPVLVDLGISVPTRAAIEAALLVRPDPLNRNWKSSETVADLLAENAAHLEMPI